MCRWGDRGLLPAACGGHLPAAQQPEGEQALGIGLQRRLGSLVNQPVACIVRQPQADRPWQAGPQKVPSISEGSSRFPDSCRTLELEITVSEFFAFPLLCPLTPEPSWDYLISFPLEDLLYKQSLRCHRCDSELFRSCFLKSVIVVRAGVHSLGAGCSGRSGPGMAEPTQSCKWTLRGEREGCELGEGV